MAKIHLLGTYHFDKNNTVLLENALELEQPEILTIEAHEDFSMEKINDVYNKIAKRLQEKGVKKQQIDKFLEVSLNIACQEKKVCDNYSNQYNIPLYYVEGLYGEEMADGIRDKIFQEWTELIALNDLESIISKLNFMIRYIETVNSNESKIYSKLFLDAKYLSLEQNECDVNRTVAHFDKRDGIMARKIAELARTNQDSKIVHVGGLAHLLNDEKGETLYSKLKEEFNPTRATLWDYA